MLDWIKAVIKKLIYNGPDFKRLQKDLYVFSDSDNIYCPSLKRYPFYAKGISNRINSFRYRYKFKNLNKGSLIIDIGSHIGEFTIFSAPIVKHVICFEPDPIVLQSLKKNISRFDNVTLFPFALDKISRKKTLYIATSTADTSLFKPNRFKFTKTIDTYALDDIDLNVHGYSNILLKLEAEGFEQEVLSGARKYLSKINEVSIDVSPERDNKSNAKEVCEILKSFGFVDFNIDNNYILHAINSNI